MKIAFDAYPIASPALSGVGIHAYNIARGIAKRGEVDCELLLYDFLRRRGSEKILKSRIPNTVKVGESIYYGEPLLEYAPESKACAAYQGLAREVIAYEG